ncbi:antitoxin [Drancourtella sp. An57]|uniref:HEPN domain-containing protein n=1 Tax=Drancourtella sp. An57 TaxID=1965647 RepID=UPI000B3ABD78|nr:HEPN domain-containing protein [Drancourtella sp. An57]OUN67559.1 antitoxin [Drancourtella sp. An57]
MAGSIKDLSKYRYERSSEELENAKTMLESGKFKLALNRSYYSIFHGIRAVNVLDEFDSSKHSGVIAHFNQYHVKTGDFPKEASRIIRTSSEMREHADYDH